MSLSSLKKIFHWGPIIALVIIKTITGTTLHFCRMWWPPESSYAGVIHIISFMSMAGFTFYHFFSSISNGPGFVPIHWHPDNEEHCKYLQWCSICEGYKAPRSHHCRKCGRCVMKMDHHCPWINGCVGWKNHFNFTAFLFFAVVGCAHAVVVLSFSLYHGINRVWYIYYGNGTEPVVYLNIFTLVACVFSLGLAIGVFLAVGMLLFFQVRAIFRNRTGIEDWILEKANHRRRNSPEDTFIFPYDLGKVKNVQQVCNWRCEPEGDGVEWDVVEGCDQYTLTREQIEQKSEKRLRTKCYKIIYGASGSWVPISHGLRVVLQPPCSDETRLKLNVGDIVRVTRWKQHWMFGEVVESSTTRRRGWFPRRCAIEHTEDDDLIEATNKLKTN